MSLRDQLLKAGLTNKKKVQSTNRALKKKRRKKQSARESDNLVREREQSQRSAQRQTEIDDQIARRKTKEQDRTERENKRRVDNLLRDHRIQVRPGPQSVWHRSADQASTHRLDVTAETARALSSGKLAVAWMGRNPQKPDYILVPAPTARQIQAHDPHRVLFLAEGTASDVPEDQPLKGSAAPDIDDIEVWLERKARLAKLLQGS